MTEAQKIMAQPASDKQKFQWACGNAVAQEHDSHKGSADFHFADGSTITVRALIGMRAS